MTDNQRPSASSPVGIFDSGIGGLSVVRHIRSLLPEEDLLYVADSAHAPYGNQTREFIQQRSRHICEFLQEQGAKAIVVACNTATAAAVDHLRAELDLPIIAMEPGIKPAAANSQSGVIGVLATAGTLQSDRYAALLNTHGDRVRVLERVCHHWVEHVEQGDLASAATQSMVTAEVEPLINQGADVLVLGCTHFPFLEAEIQQAAGESVSLVDPGPAVARQLDRRLDELELRNPQQRQTSITVWSSTQRGNEEWRIAALLDEPIRFNPFPSDD